MQQAEKNRAQVLFHGAAVRCGSGCSVEQWEGAGARQSKRERSGRTQASGTATYFNCNRQGEASGTEVCACCIAQIRGGARR